MNNTTAAPNGSTSRPDPDGNCRPMAGSEGHPEQTNWLEYDNLWHLGNSTTSTAILTYSYLIQQALTLPVLLIQQPNLAPYSDWYSKLLRYHISTDTASYYMTILLSIQLIQQATTWLYSYRYNKLLCSIPLLIQHYYVSLILWYSKILRYHSYDTTI